MRREMIGRSNNQTIGAVCLALVTTGTLWAAGCGGSEGQGADDDVPIFAAADPSKTCRPGYVGWDFATGGTKIENIPSPIKIQSATCITIAPSPPDELSKIKTACDGQYNCEVRTACPGKLQVTWTCGAAVVEPLKALGDPSLPMTIACTVPNATSDTGARTPAGAVCVPRHCPANMRRDNSMNCMQDAIKPQITKLAMDYPRIISVQKTGEEGGFLPKTMYWITVGVKIQAAERVQTQATVWLTDEFFPKKADGTIDTNAQSIQAFRCTAAHLDVDFPGASYERMIYLEQDQELSPECADARVSARVLEEAADKAGLTVAEFKQRYVLNASRPRVSWDMDNRTLPPDSTGLLGPRPQDGCASDPPGFFYNPTRKTVDMIAYYAQREFMANSTETRPFTGLPEEPSRIEIGPTFFKVKKPEITVRLKSRSQASFPVDMGWYMAGDNPKNPYSFSSVYKDQSLKTLADRNLRATVYIAPIRRNREGALYPQAWEELKQFPLTKAALPSGSVISARVAIPNTVRNLMFQHHLWKTQDFFSVYYCLEADGLDPKWWGTVPYGTFVQSLELPAVTVNGKTYKAGISAGVPKVNSNALPTDFKRADMERACIEGGVLRVIRDDLDLPLEPESDGAGVAAQDTTSSGDKQSSGSQDNGSERDCVGNTCTDVQNSGAGSSGSLRGTSFDATTSSKVTQAEDGPGGSASSGMEAEALGFEVINVDDEGQAMKWDNPASTPREGISLTITPSWDALINALKYAAHGTSPVEVTKGRFSGRDGIGLAAGIKVPFKVGTVTLKVSAGVSVGLNVNIKLRPDTEYPCLGEGTNNCFAEVGKDTPLSQKDAQAACAVKGGRLAELRSQADLTALQAAITDTTAPRWIGGQLGYVYPQPNCYNAYDKTACEAGTKTRFRWLRDNSEFAVATGPNGASLDTQNIFVTTSNPVRLVPPLPNAAGVTYKAQDASLGVSTSNTLWPAVCVFERASSTSFRGWSVGLAVGAGAGVSVSFCTPPPSGDPGVCLEGSAMVVNIDVTPTVGEGTTTLFRTSTDSPLAIKLGRPVQKPFAKVGNFNVTVPWKLNLFSANVALTLNFVIGSLSWTIVEYPGFTVAEGSLYDFNAPYSEVVP